MLRPRLARLLARSLSMTPQQVPPVLDSAAKPAAQAHVPAPAPAEITQTESAHHPPPPVDRPATPSQGSPMMGPPIHDEMAAYPATWSTPLRIAINSIRTIIELGKNSVYRARLLTANAVTPYPVLSVTITPVTIVRRSDLVLEGMSAEEAKGSFEAEWVEHRSVARRRTTKKKGSEKSPVELTTETPTETVVLPQGPWGDVESEIAVTNGNVENGAGESSRAVKTEPQEDSLLRRFTKWSGVGSESEGKVPEPPKIMDAPEHERVILYIHGGAFVIGSRKLHRGITWMLSKYGGGASVLSIDYRLSPPSCFPLPLQDCLSAYLHLIAPQVSSSIPESREGISDGGKVVMRYKPSQIVLMGDSAGGNLCLATVLYLREHGKKLREQYGIEAKNIMPAGVGGLSPWCDLSHSQPSFLLNGEYDIVPFASADPKYIDTSRNHYYIKDNTFLRDPLVSPMYAHVDDSDKGESGELLPLPPILLHCGTSERLYHEILFFGRSTLEKSASPVYLEVYEDMPHVFQFFAMFESLSDVSLRRLGKFAIDVTTKVPSPTNGDKEEASPTWDPRGADPTGEWHKSNHMADLGQVLPNYNKTKPYLRRFTYIRNNVTISASSSPTAEPTTTKDVQAGTEPGPTSSVSRRVRDIHITEVPLEDPLEIIAAGAVRLAKLQELGAVNDDGTISRRPSRPRSTHARTGSNSSTSSFGSWWSSERASSRKTMQKDSFRRISTAAKAANAFAYPARTVSLKDVEIEASVTESQGSTFSKWSGGVMERLSSWVENDWGAHAKAVSEQATLLWQTMSMDIVDFAGEGVDDEGSVIPGPGFDERGGDSGIK